MSACHQTYRRGACVALVLAIVITALPALLNAQTAPAPKASTSAGDAVPKAEFFVGYQWLNPGGDVPNNDSPPNPFHLPSIAPGGGTNFSYNFSDNFAGEANVGIDWNRYADVEALTIGPKYTWRGEGVNYFIHALGGWERLGARTDRSFNSTGPVILAGGGMDLKFWKLISIRLFEADYQWTHQNFAGEVSLNDPDLRETNFKGVRLTTGVVFNLGGAPEVPVAAACSIDRNEVMVGEPLHATVSASNFNPKHTLTYAWTTTGGKIEGKDTGASIDTNGAAPGSYTATATVTDARAKKNNMASCTANFTVKPQNPPQISCSASPATVEIGGSSTITCSCTSPDNATVTVGGWTSTGGRLSGSGNSATLSTTGASAGPVTVSATCTDSRGLTASASSTVTVNAAPPPPPPPPQASKVNECEYPNKMKPWRVDNTCKAELDDVALKLQQDPDAKLVVVGNAGPKEKRKNLAAERALNVKAYISGGEAKQNIDASRIEARTGNAGTATSEQWIVPAGATFPGADSTMTVDEKKVKAVPDHPKPMAKKKKAE